MRGADPSHGTAEALLQPDIALALQGARRVAVLSVGKAAERMLVAFESQARRPWDSALVIAPTPPGRHWPSVEWRVTAHPVPDQRSVDAARRALALVRELSPEDLLLVLISGGASSLMALPTDGLPFEDKQRTLARLLTAGVDIGALNTVRKHLSAIKGGRLAAATAARVLTLAASDVVGDDLSTIGSGPTVADPTSFAMALDVVQQHRAGIPDAVGLLLEAGTRGDLEETPKRFPSDRVFARVVASRLGAMAAAARAGASLGYHVHEMALPVTGEARVAGRGLLDAAMRVAAPGQPVCVVAGGETVVQVRGRGRGGRNQELVLAMVPELARHPGVAVASVGTDGVDGPTDAAGARADSHSLVRGRAAGLDPEALLADNDSYRFFDALGDLIRTGPTGSNAGDVQIVMIDSGRGASR